MSIDYGNKHDGDENLSTTTSCENPNNLGGNYRLNPAALNTLMDSTDDSRSVNSTSTNATSIDTNCTSPNNKNRRRNDNPLFKGDPHFTELMEDSDNLLYDSKKRSSNDTNNELQTDRSPRQQRFRRHSKVLSASSASASTSSSDVLVSLLTKRLNKLSVKERHNAMCELHGIPLDNEYYDTELGVRGNTIERDPPKLHKSLLALDQMVKKRIKISKLSHAEGENFVEPQLFPELTPEQQYGSLSSRKTSTAPNTNPLHNSTHDVGYLHIPATDTTSATAASNYEEHNVQRILFLKHELEHKEFGEGLRLANQQNPGYVYAQRIKFLRACRYDVNLASARMIRFFDTKRELFCSPGYNDQSDTDLTECLGRDLRLSDFSKEDFELWKKTGFLQMCGMRDRAKRAIVVMFGKIISEAKIPTGLVMRAYLYVMNLWSRDESTQLAGVVVIGYSTFSDALSSRKGASSSTASTAKGGKIGSDGHGDDSNINEEVIERYLKQTNPLSAQLNKVGMSSHLRVVSMHFCYDHPKLNAQFEKIAGYMCTFAAARFRCHYANDYNLDLNKSKNIGTTPNEYFAASDHTHNTSNSNHDEAIYASRAQQRQDKNHNSAAVDLDFNPHKELMYTLMTFGIPRETVPVNDVTGEIDLLFHQAILEAIEEREYQDRLLGAAEAASSASGTGGKQKSSDESMSLSSSASSDKLWMSLTASIGSRTSFALFPNLFENEELGNGSDHTASSLFGSVSMPPTASLTAKNKSSQDELSDPSPSPSALLVSSSTDNYGSSSTPDNAAASETPPSTESPTWIFEPAPNDIIMGRGPWNRNHPGNLRLKAMLERERDRYECVNRFERMRIVDAMLNELYHDFGTRFLYKPKAKELDSMQPDDTSSDTLPQQTPTSTVDNVWLEANREKAHDKITHDFRNLRRQKNASPKPKQKHGHRSF